VQLRTLYIKVRSWRTICYVSGVLAMFQLVVISFSKKGKSVLRGLPF
jgi:hypothetical protein